MPLNIFLFTNSNIDTQDESMTENQVKQVHALPKTNKSDSRRDLLAYAKYSIKRCVSFELNCKKQGRSGRQDFFHKVKNHVHFINNQYIATVQTCSKIRLNILKRLSNIDGCTTFTLLVASINSGI